MTILSILSLVTILAILAIVSILIILSSAVAPCRHGESSHNSIPHVIRHQAAGSAHEVTVTSWRHWQRCRIKEAPTKSLS